MKVRPTILEWLRAWLRLRNARPGAWYRWHRDEANAWLDQATREIGQDPEPDRARRAGL